MAKQIKVIKCPQCGNTKPLTIGTDHYRCDKCGTEFFLDNDDVNVNVNVNHRYESTNTGNTSPVKGIVISVIVVMVIIVMLAAKFCVDQVTQTTRNVTPAHRTVEQPKTPQRGKYAFSALLSAKETGTAFYVIDQNKKAHAKFLNVAAGNVIGEQELPVTLARNQNIEYRYFLSDDTHYVIINGNLIYKIVPENRMFTDVTADICARKPALEAGLMSVSFVPEEQGEGFRINTNLGKELYYFPKADMLYTEKAFQYVAKDISKPLLPGAKDITYYLFLNKESAHSSNVAQLFEITYKFNNGGPENRLMRIDEAAMKNLDKYRIVSCKPVTDERVYFSPEILFYDSRNILIAYQPSLAKDAGIRIQLLDTSGNIVWTKSAGINDLKNIHAVRTDRGFMLQASENSFFEIDADGQNVQTYKLP